MLLTFIQKSVKQTKSLGQISNLQNKKNVPETLNKFKTVFHTKILGTGI